ncbi:MAG TPA: SIMPL domain-containing protein, partial [Pirellulales bacterium]
MTLKRIFPAAATAVLCLATAGLVHAQRPFAAMGGENTVTGTGVEIVRHPPEILRMQIEITAKGKTLANALKKLAEHRDAALAQLAKMSSEKEGTRAGEAQIAATTNPRQQQMEMMVRQRMRQSGKKAKTTPDKPLSVSCTLTAEWKL